MKTDITIPEVVEEATVSSVTISIVSQIAYVPVRIPGKAPQTVKVDLSDKIASVSVEARTAVKNFLKYITAQGLAVAESSLPDTIFESDEADSSSAPV